MAHILTHYSLSPPNRQAGLSLVELMISLTIGLLLLAGLTTLIVKQSSTRDELEKSSRQIENGRYAMQILHDDIQHAGFYGQYFSLAAPGAGMPDPCATDQASLIAAMPLPIQGYDSPAASPIACIANANYKPGTDILVIRRANTKLETDGSPPSGSEPPEFLLQANAASYVLSTVVTSFNINTPPLPAPFTLTGKDGTTPAPIREYWVHIYFVSPCSVPAGGGATCTGAADDNGHPIPTLKMLDVTGEGGAISPALPIPVPLVEGIENMQLDYGIDNGNDGYPDNYTTAPATSAAWSNVMAIRVNLLARNTECTTGYTDNKTYNLGLVTVSAPASTCTNGGYKRHAYSELVRAINPSGRRATQ